ncbi:hypothetical protein [Scytonema hofmannii]|nr:hypothetical protein [Scytonema hofmannii]
MTVIATIRKSSRSQVGKRRKRLHDLSIAIHLLRTKTQELKKH